MEDKSKVAIGIFGAVILVISLLFCIFYRKEAQIVVEDRWWSYYKAYKWDETITYPEAVTKTWIDSNGNTHTETTIVLKTKTTVHTRCDATRTGRELPAQAPEMPCSKYSGDYEYDYVTYNIRYHESEQGEVKTATIPAESWDSFEQRKVVNVKITLFKHITDFEVLNRLFKKVSYNDSTIQN